MTGEWGVRDLSTYEDACSLIQEWGLVPLSGGIPAHPSIDSCTKTEMWHTDREDDPWIWRVRLPSEGMAAYGRLIGNQTLFVGKDVFPLMQAVLRSSASIEARYEDERLSKSAFQLYDLIRDNPGIDTKLLRKLSGMDEKSQKKAYDRALIDLQNTADIVISGVYDPRNKQGVKSGWSSACYMLADDWMSKHGLIRSHADHEQAWDQLLARFANKWSEEAIVFVRKKLDKHRMSIGR
jgi:hypothetical protein